MQIKKQFCCLFSLYKLYTLAANRGRLAQQLLKQVTQSYPNYPHLTKEWGSSSKQANVILNGADALQLLYKDPTLKILYEDLRISQDSSENNLYPVVAKIY